MQLGALGSLVFVGIAIGSTSATIILNKVPYKLVLTITPVMNALGLFLLTATRDYSLMCVSRIICGLCQTFITIYAPIWVDSYSLDAQKKSSQLTLMMLGPVIGIVIGYIVSAAMISNGCTWQSTFYVHASLNLICSVIICLVPSRYVNIDELLD